MGLHEKLTISILSDVILPNAILPNLPFSPNAILPNDLFVQLSDIRLCEFYIKSHGSFHYVAIITPC